MGEPELLSLVEVTWLDHTFNIGPYDPKRELDGLTIWTSVGYLIRSDDRVLVLAQSVEGANEPHECLHVQAGHVLKVVRLKQGKEVSL